MMINADGGRRKMQKQNRNFMDTSSTASAPPSPLEGKDFGARCKNCIYGLQVYKADGLIDCEKKGGVRLEEDGCEEGHETEKGKEWKSKKFW